MQGGRQRDPNPMAEKKEESLQLEEEKEATMMKPWEQHSAVINIPRFDYNAPSSLLHHSFSGFLVTCPIKREKSATKEVMSILEQFIGSSKSCNSEGLKISDEITDAKRRKVCTGEIDVESINCVESKSSTALISADDKLSESSCLSSMKSDANIGSSNVLSLVKLIRSGLLLFIFPKDHSHNVVDTVANIIQSLVSGSLKSPLWCYRIFPIQATCTLNEKELSTVVSKLVIRFVNDEGNKLMRPTKLDIIEEELRRPR